MFFVVQVVLALTLQATLKKRLQHTCFPEHLILKNICKQLLLANEIFQLPPKLEPFFK